MAWFSACYIYFQNLFFGNKNELADITPIGSNNTPIILFALILSAAVAPPIIFALFFMTPYLKDDFQQILRTVLNSKPLAPFLAPVSAPKHYKDLCERPLKA